MRNIKALMTFLVLVLTALPGAVAAQVQFEEEGKDVLATERARYVAKMSADGRASAASNDIDVTYYGLNIAVLPATQRVRGSVVVQARVLAQVQSVTLDMANALAVDSVLVNGTAMAFQQDINSLTYSLDRAYTAGEQVSAEIFYGGAPVSSGFGSFAFGVSGGLPWVWTLSEPYGARGWWPCKDHPSDKADSVDVRITCPAGLTAVSQGLLVSTTNNVDNTTTYHWKHRYPIATYLVSLAIANYETFSDWYPYSPVDSMEITNYVLPGLSATLRSNIGRTPEMLGIYGELFGSYPFLQEKYGHAQFGWGGAMEHQTISSMGSFSVSIIAHELTHQWFGDMISPRFWRDIWLNEGFATYGVALYFERASTQASFKAYMANQMISASQAQGTLSVADTSNVGALFSGSLVYAKGSVVLHMLRHAVGDSAFFAGLRAYAGDPRFRFNVATTEELQGVFETASGKDLSYFFTQWVYGERYPRYFCSWTAQPEGAGHRISLTITQTTGTTNPALFTMPLDLKFSSASADTVFTVWNSSSDTTYTFDLPFLPRQFTLDPDNWVLKSASYANDGEAVPITFALEQNYPNPFNPGTTIAFFVPPTTGGPGTDAHVTLKVFDLLGREVATLVNEELSFGTHTAVWDAGTQPSGVYLYRLSSGSFSTTKKMVVLK